MTNQAPDIAVIMAVYNESAYVCEAIESILNQSFTNFEFIIVDDGSTDDSLKKIRSFDDKRITIIRQENRGASAARNRAVEAARAEYIAVLDSDDVAETNRLEKQYRYLEKHPSVIAVGGLAAVITEEGNYLYTIQKEINPEKIKSKLPKMAFIHPTVMFRRNKFIKAGGYPGKFEPMEDCVLFNRMSRFGDYANIPEPLIKYRITPASISRTSKKLKAYLYFLVAEDFRGEEITDEQMKKLQRLREKDTGSERLYAYHTFLAKKFLWNNYQPLQSRAHAKKALEYKKNMFGRLLWLATFLPEKVVLLLYKRLKKPVSRQ